jgi:hypothetical protein
MMMIIIMMEVGPQDQLPGCPRGPRFTLEGDCEVVFFSADCDRVLWCGLLESA